MRPAQAAQAQAAAGPQRRLPRKRRRRPPSRPRPPRNRRRSSRPKPLGEQAAAQARLAAQATDEAPGRSRSTGGCPARAVHRRRNRAAAGTGRCGGDRRRIELVRVRVRTAVVGRPVRLPARQGRRRGHRSGSSSGSSSSSSGSSGSSSSSSGSSGDIYSADAAAWAETPFAQAVRMCESSNNYSINTGSGYYGAWQFDYPSWHGNGGGQFAEYPPPGHQGAAGLRRLDLLDPRRLAPVGVRPEARRRLSVAATTRRSLLAIRLFAARYSPFAGVKLNIQRMP